MKFFVTLSLNLFLASEDQWGDGAWAGVPGSLLPAAWPCLLPTSGLFRMSSQRSAPSSSRTPAPLASSSSLPHNHWHPPPRLVPRQAAIGHVQWGDSHRASLCPTPTTVTWPGGWNVDWAVGLWAYGRRSCLTLRLGTSVWYVPNKS